MQFTLETFTLFNERITHLHYSLSKQVIISKRAKTYIRKVRKYTKLRMDFRTNSDKKKEREKRPQNPSQQSFDFNRYIICERFPLAPCVSQFLEKTVWLLRGKKKYKTLTYHSSVDTKKKKDSFLCHEIRLLISLLVTIFLFHP